MDTPTVLLHDTDGRSLLCFLERSLLLDSQPYGLLQPVDAPAVIFSWENDGEEPVPVEDEDTIKTIFPTAKAVLEEQNLTLLSTAITLTVEGDLPDVEEEDVNSGAELNGSEHHQVDDADDLDEAEEFQLLAIFYHQEQEYGVYTPLDPFLIVARLDNDEPQLISPEEYERIEPLLEAALAEQIEAEEEGRT